MGILSANSYERGYKDAKRESKYNNKEWIYWIE
jgi:hypothetical protein